MKSVLAVALVLMGLACTYAEWELQVTTVTMAQIDACKGHSGSCSDCLNNGCDYYLAKPTNKRAGTCFPKGFGDSDDTFNFGRLVQETAKCPSAELDECEKLDATLDCDQCVANDKCGWAKASKEADGWCATKAPKSLDVTEDRYNECLQKTGQMYQFAKKVWDVLVQQGDTSIFSEAQLNAAQALFGHCATPVAEKPQILLACHNTDNTWKSQRLDVALYYSRLNSDNAYGLCTEQCGTSFSGACKLNSYDLTAEKFNIKCYNGANEDTFNADQARSSDGQWAACEAACTDAKWTGACDVDGRRYSSGVTLFRDRKRQGPYQVFPEGTWESADFFYVSTNAGSSLTVPTGYKATVHYNDGTDKTKDFTSDADDLGSLDNKITKIVVTKVGTTTAVADTYTPPTVPIPEFTCHIDLSKVSGWENIVSNPDGADYDRCLYMAEYNYENRFYATLETCPVRQRCKNIKPTDFFSSNPTCTSCLGDSECGYCLVKNNGQTPFGFCVAKEDEALLCSQGEFFEDKTAMDDAEEICPGDEWRSASCSDLTDCGLCTRRSDCAICGDPKGEFTCVPFETSESGETTSGSCATENLLNVAESACPIAGRTFGWLDPCSSSWDQCDCATRPECGWCDRNDGTGKCLQLNGNQMPADAVCVNELFTKEQACVTTQPEDMSCVDIYDCDACAARSDCGLCYADDPPSSEELGQAMCGDNFDDLNAECQTIFDLLDKGHDILSKQNGCGDLNADQKAKFISVLEQCGTVDASTCKLTSGSVAECRLDYSKVSWADFSGDHTKTSSSECVNYYMRISDLKQGVAGIFGFQQGSCQTLGEKRCMTEGDAQFFQECVEGPSGAYEWSTPMNQCGQGTCCIANGSQNPCRSLDTCESGCTLDEYRCNQDGTYSKCVSQFGTTVWSDRTECDTGLSCKDQNDHKAFPCQANSGRLLRESGSRTLADATGKFAELAPFCKCEAFLTKLEDFGQRIKRFIRVTGKNYNQITVGDNFKQEEINAINAMYKVDKNGEPLADPTKVNWDSLFGVTGSADCLYFLEGEEAISPVTRLPLAGSYVCVPGDANGPKYGICPSDQFSFTRQKDNIVDQLVCPAASRLGSSPRNPKCALSHRVAKERLDLQDSICAPYSELACCDAGNAATLREHLQSIVNPSCGAPVSEKCTEALEMMVCAEACQPGFPGCYSTSFLNQVWAECQGSPFMCTKKGDGVNTPSCSPAECVTPAQYFDGLAAFRANITGGREGGDHCFNGNPFSNAREGLDLFVPDITPTLPTISGVPSTLIVKKDQQVSYSFSADDVDGDALTLASYNPHGNNPSGVTVTDKGNKQADVTWTPNTAGPFTVCVSATDVDGNIAHGCTSITVQPSCTLDCLGRGTCNDNSKCQCTTGWSGSYCQTPVFTQCRSTGDPHFRGFDGRSFNQYHGGEFDLARVPNYFRVQARHEYGNVWPRNSINGAIAILNHHNGMEEKVMIDRRGLFVDGVATEMSGGSFTSASGVIASTRGADKYRLSMPDNVAYVDIDIYWCYINVYTYIRNDILPTADRGLCVNRQGRRLEEGEVADKIENTVDSAFTYGAGLGPKTADPGPEHVVLEDPAAAATEEERAAATAACATVPEASRDDCIADVIVAGGDATIVRATEQTLLAEQTPFVTASTCLEAVAISSDNRLTHSVDGKNYYFAVLGNSGLTSNKECQAGVQALPAGYQLATSDETKAVLAANAGTSFGADCVVASDGKSYKSRTGDLCGIGQLATEDSCYGVLQADSCVTAQKVLIRSTAEASSSDTPSGKGAGVSTVPTIAALLIAMLINALI